MTDIPIKTKTCESIIFKSIKEFVDQKVWSLIIVDVKSTFR